MIESLERRAVTLAAAAGLVVVLNSATSLAFAFGVESWKVALSVASLVAMVVCIGLSLLAIAPESSWKAPARTGRLCSSGRPLPSPSGSR